MFQMTDIELENSRLVEQCQDLTKELQHLREQNKSKDEKIIWQDSELKRLQGLLEDNQVSKDLQSELAEKKNRLDEMYDWYDYLAAEKRRLTEHAQWLEGRVHCLQDINQRRERCMEEGRSQYRFLISKHQTLLNKTSLLEAQVEGLRNERDVFDDLRAEYKRQKSCEPDGIPGILKKEQISAAVSSHKVRFNDSANTEVLFDSYSANTESNSSRFDITGQNEVIFDCRPVRHESKSHRASYSAQSDTELIFDFRNDVIEPPVQNLNQSDNDSTSPITEDSCKEGALDSGYSSENEVFEDCV